MKALESTREYDEDYQSQQFVTPTDETTDTTTANEATVAPATEETTEVALEEPAFIDGSTEETPPLEDAPAEPEAKEEVKPSTRKSKVTEVSKADHEKAEKEKRQAKAKQAAKERLAKSYVPSYKKDSEKTANTKAKDESSKKSGDEKATEKKSDKSPVAGKPIGIVDVAPGKFIDPTKKAIYARERAALTALASQRKLNGTVPLYVATHMNFKSRVFVNRVEYSGSFGKNVLPIEKIAWVKLRYGGTGVIIETVEGKRVVMVVKQADRLAFADAILKVQAMQPKKGKFKDTKTVRIDELEKFGDGVDEIEKLAKLYDKGILSQEEFDAKKKQILGL